MTMIHPPKMTRRRGSLSSSSSLRVTHLFSLGLCWVLLFSLLLPTVSGNNRNGQQQKETDAAEELELWPDPEILKNIADADNNIILASMNCGYIDFAQNWILHLQKLNLNNFLIVGQDEYVTNQLNTIVPGHVVLLPQVQKAGKTDDPSIAYEFLQPGFKNVNKPRPNLIRYILQQGYNVLYSDVDIAILKNPFEKFNAIIEEGTKKNVPPYDIIGQCDSFPRLEQYPEEPETHMCSGFIYFQATTKSIELCKDWYKLMIEDNYVKGDQVYLNRARKGRAGNTYNSYMLDKTEFVPGFIFFKTRKDARTWVKEWEPKENTVYMTHANWMIGSEAKRNALKSKNLWIVKDEDVLKCNVNNGNDSKDDDSSSGVKVDRNEL